MNPVTRRNVYIFWNENWRKLVAAFGLTYLFWGSLSLLFDLGNSVPAGTKFVSWLPGLTQSAFVLGIVVEVSLLVFTLVYWAWNKGRLPQLWEPWFYVWVAIAPALFGAMWWLTVELPKILAYKG